MTKALRGFGFILFFLLAYGGCEIWQHRGEKKDFIGGLRQPIVTVELARDTKHVEPVKDYFARYPLVHRQTANVCVPETFSASEREERWQAALKHSVQSDSALIIPFYGCLLLFFSVLLLLHRFRGAVWYGGLALLFTLGIVGFDYVENAGIVQLFLQPSSGPLANADLSRIWKPSLVKWALLFLTTLCLSALFLGLVGQSAGKTKWFYQAIRFLIGLLLVVEGLVGLWALGWYFYTAEPTALIEWAFYPGILAVLLITVLFVFMPKRFLAGLRDTGKPPKPAALPVPLFRVLLEEYEMQRQQSWMWIKKENQEQRVERRLPELTLDQCEYEVRERKYAVAATPAEQAQLRDEMQQLDEDLVAEFYRQLHEKKAWRAALCFSGGGVRSATFALGLVQGLIKQDIPLGNFHFLSTVSGGGYTGSWLSAWMHRDGLKRVENALRKPQGPINPEPAPLQHLRRYSNPLTPNLGLTSADTWTLVGTYLRNLSLNWLVLLPLLMVFLAAPRLAMAFACWDQPPGLLLNALPLIGLFLGCFSMHYFVTNRPSLARRKQGLLTGELPQDEVGFLRWCLVPLLLAAALCTSYWAWAKPGSEVSLFVPWWLGLLALCAGLALVRLCWKGDTQGRRWPKSKWPYVMAALILLASAASALWWSASPKTLTLSLAAPVIFLLFGWANYAGGMFLSWLLAGRWDKREVIFSLFLTGLTGGLFLWAGAQMIPEPVNIQAVREVRKETPQTSPTVTPKPQPDRQLVKLSGDPLTLTLETDAQGKQTALKLETPITTETKKGTDEATRSTAEKIGKLKRTGWFIVFGTPVFLLAFAAAATLFIGLSSGITTDADREWMARAGAWLLMAGGGWVILSTTVLFGAEWNWQANTYAMAALTTGSGLTTLILGWLPKTVANTQSGAGQEGRLVKLGLPLAAIIFALAVFALLSLAMDGLLLGLLGVVKFPLTWIYTHFFPASAPPLSLLAITPANFGQWHWVLLHELSGPVILCGVAVLLLVGGVFGLFVNVNKFSLHAANRDRLIRAYLGASNTARRANPFTGFDLRDDFQMHELLEPLFTETDFVQFDHFADWLKCDQDQKARYLWSEFAESTRQQLQRYPVGVSGDAMQVSLAREFNRLIHGELLAPLPRSQQKWWQRWIAQAFYQPKHAQGIFTEADVTKISQPLSDEERKGLIQNVPVFPGLPGKLALERPVPLRRLWLNRRLLEEACQDKDKGLRFLKTCAYKFQDEARPFHVVNMTLNLVNGKELAWQERKARSFFATPLHIGAPGIGLRRAAEYATTFDGKGAMTLGTALAISGAAANPNAGYNSSPLITFFLTLFNVRLGWWLGNPGQAGQHTYRASSPFFAPNVLLQETFGFTDDQHPYVNVSDGGHFDNLGLYEMVRRRCHFILVSDGGQDEKYNYDDLGIAIRLIRADLGVPIVFKSPLCSGSHRGSADKRVLANQFHFAIAEIQYNAVDDVDEKHNGILILVKPAVYGKEPADIYNYALSNSAFPNDPTFTDQFFSESQFESYRHLGEYTIEKLAEGLKPPSGTGCGIDPEVLKKADEGFERLKLT